MTPDQSALLDRLTKALGQDPRVQALWLHGSFAHGGGDAWSDIDLVAQVDAADQAACMRDYRGSRSGLPDRVHTFEVYGCIVSSVTATWERFDIVFLPEALIHKTYGPDLKPLLGTARRLDGKPDADVDPTAPARVEALILEFLRVLGLGPVAIGREEWIVCQQGLALLRSMVVDLMLDANGVSRADRGAKRLNAFLTQEQRAAMESLAPAPAQRDDLIREQGTLGRLFLQEARPLAARLGIAWPAAFETATREHLRAQLGLEI